MEKKEAIKVSFSTLFLIIAIIIIFVMGYFMYKLYNDKVEETNKATDLQKQVVKLNETINDLQGKINSINDTINTDNTSGNTTKTSENTKNTVGFTEEEAKKAISNYLELDAHASCGALLTKLTENGQINFDQSKYNINTSTGEITTNVKFSDYKKAMLNYVTEAEFERNWTSKQYFNENANGYLTTMQGGGGLRIYTIKSISKNDDTTFSVTTSSVVEDGKHYEENNFTFTVKSNNGKCVIDSCK